MGPPECRHGTLMSGKRMTSRTLNHTVALAFRAIPSRHMEDLWIEEER